MAKISSANKGKKRPVNAGSHSQRIEVLDLLTNKSTVFDSICAAARAIEASQSRISEHLMRNSSNKKLYKARYTFKKYSKLY